MRIIVIFVCLLAPSFAVAEELRVDQDVFATCSKQTNQLSNLNAGLQRMHVQADAYNRKHDWLRALLDHREAEVHQIHNELRGKPIKKKTWKRYEDAFQQYEQALGELRAWNESGDALGANYTLALEAVKTLQDDISARCKGKWEPAIINKFCDDNSGRHSAFCNAFEK